MEGTGTDEPRPHCNNLGRPASLRCVNDVCAPKSPTGSNEPQKCFGRSDHVEALSQLGPLRSRKGMSQLGIPKMRQTSHFLRHKPSTVRCGHLRFQSKGNSDKPPFNGSTGGTLRAHPGLARGQAHLWICIRN